MMEQPGAILRNVGLVPRAGYALFGIAVLKELKRRTGCRTTVYVWGPESARSHEKFREQGSVDEIVRRDVMFPAAASCDLAPETVFARARAMEEFIGCTYNEVMMGRRDIGRGFALGGFRHARFPAVDRLSYTQVVHGLTAMLEFWKHEFESKRLDLIIDGQKDVAVTARACDVAFRYLYGTRIDNLYFWTRSEFLDFPNLEQAYENLSARECPPVTIDRPYDEWRK